MDNNSSNSEDFPHLQNAPATEAILSVRFNKNEDFSIEQIHALCDELQKDFPKRTNILAQENNIRDMVSSAEPHYEKDEIVGVAMSSDEKKLNLRIKQDSLFLSKLQPYTDGEDLINNFRFIFDMYISFLNPEMINKISMRYINELTIDAENADEYLKCTPNISFFHGQDAFSGDSLMQMVVSEETKKDFAQVTQLITPCRNKKGNIDLKVILDIDAIRNEKFEPNWNILKNIITDLRYLKNNVFFGFLSQDCIASFK